MAVTHSHADLVHIAYLMQTGGNKAAGFHGGRRVLYYFCLGKHMVSACVKFASSEFSQGV